ncbi:hypothetical protein MRB53_031939 [Persea americana]|uniref:Uncharacterized protein n=1 Tax=Persea americana TaxID=3435 RepID=A0ACC2KQV1_PERAE|nr:hypothetical protein MRB53_031939 [Persea americana]
MVDRSFIYLLGEGQSSTVIVDSEASKTNENTTFDIIADNFVAKNKGFKNNYNNPVMEGNRIKRAVAVRVRADEVAFYNCPFFGVQYTLWDDSGRHFYQSCYIRGSIDYIFGVGAVSKKLQIDLMKIVYFRSNLVFAESGCHGPGSNTAERVSWEKTLSAEEVNTLASREQVVVDRSYIYMQGEGQAHTFIDYSNATNTLAGNIFAVTADNFVAKNIGFKNNHDRIVMENDATKQAVAARVSTDKAAFYSFSFISVQDTLWDDTGRHLYQSCYIEGSMDYIFGVGQSHFEHCILANNRDKIQYLTGCITAQARNNWNEPNGFVFMSCNVSGVGNVYIGRAWRPYARVLFYKSNLGDNVIPEGWEAWAGSSNVSNLTFAESDCSGPGSDTSKRVPWERKLSAEESNTLTSRSFIDAEGWVEQQP